MKNGKDSLLNGLQILDLADEKGSFCSKVLADMGARVIKVEKPGGDPARKIGPFLEDSQHPNKSLSFFYNNTNKIGITLDLERREGREIFLRLAKRFDVVVETFPPGRLDGLGLGFDVLRETNPGLILVSITGFGQIGPRRSYKSCDLVASAFGGQMYVTGSPSFPPLKHYGQQSYLAASLFASIGILLALRRRRQNGRGEHIDISLQEAVTSTLEHVMVQYFYENTIPKRQGSLFWHRLFHILPCKDGFIQLTLFEQWETLVEWMDGERMAEDLKDEKWNDEEYRLRHLDHIIDVLERWTKRHTTKELFELGQLMRFPWAPVHSPKEILESPHLGEREFFVDIGHPEIKTPLKYPRFPYRFSLPVSVAFKPAPLVGEDNTRIYQKELGLSEKELRRLSSQGVI
jgi:crotonobetainyl-CoA:carnitine CoA-transferase CaiB-like acyl-CoA transferase